MLVDAPPAVAALLYALEELRDAVSPLFVPGRLPRLPRDDEP